MKKIEAINSVKKYLTKWFTDVVLSNAISFFDINRCSEDLVRKIMNVVYELELKNLNEEELNYPSIDLGDKEKGISVQVTTTVNSRKIIETIEKFEKYKLSLLFPNRLMIFQVALNKLQYRKEIKTEYFDNKKDIIVLSDLMKDINNLYEIDIDRFNEVLRILESQYQVAEIEELDVTIDVLNTDNEVIKRNFIDKNFDLRYFSENEDSIMRIYPKTEYFDKLSSGNIITYTGQNWHLNLGIQFPNLDIKIVNTKKERVIITKIELEVEESKEILKHLIFLSSTNIGSEIIIRNEGFLELGEVLVKFDIFKNKEEIIYNEFMFEKKLDLSSGGINLKIKDEVIGKYPEFKEIDEKSKNGEFYNIKVICIGVIIIDDEEIPFLVDVYFCDRDMGGGMVEPSYEYTDCFQDNGNYYKIEKSCFHYIEPGGYDRILFLLKSYKHTNHKFKVKLYSKDIVVYESGTILLELFYPRNYYDEEYFEYLEYKQKRR